MFNIIINVGMGGDGEGILQKNSYSKFKFDFLSFCAYISYSTGSCDIIVDAR